MPSAAPVTTTTLPDILNCSKTLVAVSGKGRGNPSRTSAQSDTVMDILKVVDRNQRIRCDVGSFIRTIEVGAFYNWSGKTTSKANRPLSLRGTVYQSDVGPPSEISGRAPISRLWHRLIVTSGPDYAQYPEWKVVQCVSRKFSMPSTPKRSPTQYPAESNSHESPTRLDSHFHSPSHIHHPASSQYQLLHASLQADPARFPNQR